MNFIVKSLLFFYLLLEIIVSKDISYNNILILLLILAITIWKEKYYDSIIPVIIVFLLTCVAATLDMRFVVLLGLSFYDFTLKRNLFGLGFTLIGVVYFLVTDSISLLYTMLMLLCCLLAYQIKKNKQEEGRFHQTLDNERRLRYELEQTKVKLLHSSREIANIAEVKERNRIAREIHDSIGHSIAGILIQLQAAYKLHNKDQEKSIEMIQQSITGLSNSVTMLRDTVHNIKPRETLGIDYIKSIIDNFSFCPVQLKTSGDFNQLPPSHLEIISTNIKESLTNSSRYSRATEVHIVIDVTDQYTRLYIKDNGIGSKKIREGLGLSGIKERVRNLGGSVSITGEDGFLIVCVIPSGERSGIFESSNR